MPAVTIGMDFFASYVSALTTSPCANVKTVLQLLDDHKRTQGINWRLIVSDVHLENGLVGLAHGMQTEALTKTVRSFLARQLFRSEAERIRTLEGITRLPAARMATISTQTNLFAFLVTYPLFVIRTKQAEKWMPSRAAPYSAVAIREGNASAVKADTLTRFVEFAARHTAALTCYLLFYMLPMIAAARMYVAIQQHLPESLLGAQLVMRTMQGALRALATPLEVVAKHIVVSHSLPRESDLTAKKLYRGAIYNLLELPFSMLVHNACLPLASWLFGRA